MKERPILFSGPMVRAILEGRKTQTRRLVKEKQFPAPFHERALEVGVSVALREMYLEGRWEERPFPYGQPGDRLWVKETWATVYDCPELPCCEDGSGKHQRVIYRSTEPHEIDNFACSFYCDHEEPGCARWRPSIFMPRWASRITLEVTDVRVERLQDISEEDAKAEGVEPYTEILPTQRVPGPGFGDCQLGDQPHRLPFADLWESIHGPDSWEQNPWVWVVTFKRVESAAKRGAA